MTKKMPEIYLETKIVLDEDVHPSLKDSGAYITMQELGQLHVQELRDIANGEDSRVDIAKNMLSYLSNYFVEGKLPGKDGKLIKVTKKMFASGELPALITNEVVGVLMGVKLPKKEKAA